MLPSLAKTKSAITQHLRALSLSATNQRIFAKPSVADMQSMQRRFGKFLPRTADEAQVGVLLKDFEDADIMLAKVFPPIKHSRLSHG